jgi:hypothetical protein
MLGYGHTVPHPNDSVYSIHLIAPETQPTRLTQRIRGVIIRYSVIRLFVDHSRRLLPIRDGSPTVHCLPFTVHYFANVALKLFSKLSATSWPDWARWVMFSIWLPASRA